MWIRRGVTVLVLGGLLAACGQGQSQRAAVADYLKQVNKVEARLSAPFSKVTDTGNQFAEQERSGGSLLNLLPASEQQTLLTAASQIEQLRARLASLKAPHPALYLRSLLLQLIDGQATLTRELAQLVVFLPNYEHALRPLAPATKRLETALSQQSTSTAAGVAAVYAEKATALRRFQATLNGMLARLRRLHPPAVSRPSYAGQVSSLAGMSSTAGQLAGALQAGSGANVKQLLLKFDRAATSSQTVPAQKARIAAVKAYDRESVKLAKLAQAAEQERFRLANDLT